MLLKISLMWLLMHVVVAALTFYGMESTDSTPTKNINIAAAKLPHLKDRQSKLLQSVAHLVSKYVMHHVHTDVVSSSSTNNQVSAPSIPERPYPISYPKEKTTSQIKIMPLLYCEWDCWLITSMKIKINIWQVLKVFFLLHFKVDSN